MTTEYSGSTVSCPTTAMRPLPPTTLSGPTTAFSETIARRMRAPLQMRAPFMMTEFSTIAPSSTVAPEKRMEWSTLPATVQPSVTMESETSAVLAM